MSRFIGLLFVLLSSVSQALLAHSNVTTFEYDANDNLVKSTDKRGIVTSYDYDRLNRVVEERRSGVVVVKSVYSEIGDQIAIEDANGNVTAMQYNGRHEMVLESRPELAISAYAYDAMGDVIEQRDPEGRVSRTQYDLRRRKTRETNAENEVTKYRYDANDQLIGKTRPNNNQWEYRYDKLNRLTHIIDANSQSSEYGYDRESNLISQTDANGNTTQYEYDALNRKALKRYPRTDSGRAVCTYDYDENSNLVTKVDGNGQSQTHVYDALNRLVRTNYQNELQSVDRDIRYTAMSFDGNNNVTRVEDSYSSVLGEETRVDEKVYDDFDRLLSRTDSFGKKVGYTYDLNGNRTSVTDSDGVRSLYRYDDINRLVTINTVHGETNYDYDRSSLLSRVSYPNNTSAAYDYDDAMRVIAIENEQNNALVSSYAYEFDDNGNRIEQREVNGGAQEITTYDYDDNDRLILVEYPDKTVRYTYDAAYNRLSEVETQAGSVVKDKGYEYNQRNQLTDVQDALDAANDVVYGFDQNGNQISKTKGAEQSNFVFDVRDDLRRVQIGGSTVGQFLYDYSGLRIEKVGERGTERSTYDGQSVLQQYDENNATRAKFDYGATRLISLQEQGQATQFYLTDALQSVVNLTNSDGAVQARYQYDAWGIKRSEIGSSYNRFGFTGYEEDKETGLYYAKARFYDPDTGKFLSEDAWEGDHMIAPSLHRYLYGYQNPTVWVDPTGNYNEAGHYYTTFIVAKRVGYSVEESRQLAFSFS